MLLHLVHAQGERSAVPTLEVHPGHICMDSFHSLHFPPVTVLVGKGRRLPTLSSGDDDGKEMQFRVFWKETRGVATYKNR